MLCWKAHTDLQKLPTASDKGSGVSDSQVYPEEAKSLLRSFKDLKWSIANERPSCLEAERSVLGTPWTIRYLPRVSS